MARTRGGAAAHARELAPSFAPLVRPSPRSIGGEEPRIAHGAAYRFSNSQKVLGVALAPVVLTVGLLLRGGLAGWLHTAAFAVFAGVVGYRLLLIWISRTPVQPPPLPDARLPAYTIVAPLYQEAGILPQLVESLSALDYPRDRMQALIALEADDLSTIAAARRLRLPDFIQVLIVPPGVPRTKPRACNVALQHATGDLLVIYDAEDRPDPGQLREAAARFAAAPAKLACLQAPLRVGNADKAFMAGQFALEYAAQFEVALPALARLGAPFPLGGTSNHFRIDALREVGGWDAFNVTEDADLGFRLAAHGYRMGVMGRPTWEDAPTRLRDWLPQRARWIKGYVQTWFVHMRRPLQGGVGAFVAAQATLGVAILSAALHGPLSAWLAAQLLLTALGAPERIAPADMLLLAAGYLVALLSDAEGARRAGIKTRFRDLLLAPAYWPLHSLAAGHALVQFVLRPHHWDKTSHAPEPDPALDGAAAERVWRADEPDPPYPRRLAHGHAHHRLERLRPAGQRRWEEARAVRAVSGDPPGAAVPVAAEACPRGLGESRRCVRPLRRGRGRTLEIRGPPTPGSLAAGLEVCEVPWAVHRVPPPRVLSRAGRELGLAGRARAREPPTSAGP